MPPTGLILMCIQFQRSFEKADEEKKQLMGLLRTAQEEFKLLLDVEHESEDSHLNEQDSTDPPNSFTHETEFVVEACPGKVLF